MQTIVAFLLLLFPAMPSDTPSGNSQTIRATIIDTGSTNRQGLRITVDASGHATAVAGRSNPMTAADVPDHELSLEPKLCSQFIQQVQSAGSLASLPVRHCMKSVSFGSRLLVEMNGEQSPDISCPGQTDPRAQVLQKTAQEILQAAQKAGGLHSTRVFTQ